MTTVRFKFKGHLLEVTGDTDGHQFDIDSIEYLGDDQTDFYSTLMDADTSDALMEAAAIASEEDKVDRKATTMEIISPIFNEFRK